MNAADPAPDLGSDRPPVLILAAGRGKRLGSALPGSAASDGAEAIPKILLRFDGRSLLERHLERLDRAGAGPVTLVVGFRAGLIEAELERIGRAGTVSLLHNPDWHEGSVVSLAAGRAVLESGATVVLMDGDVIYGQALIDRLFASSHQAALLLDRDLEPGDEPVKICVDTGGRMVDFAKSPDVDHAWHGESVGFFRFAPEIAATLAWRAAATIAEGGRMVEYEEPIRAMIKADARGAFGFEDVTGLPWTEIDFKEDVAKAEALAPLLSETVA